jgi:muramoyltetrapeptide carboxypeptidase
MGGRKVEQQRARAMADKRLRIGVVATASRLAPEVPDKVRAVAERLYGAAAPEIVVHPSSYDQSGHFAGEDAVRAAAFVEFANDPGLDAIWFGRGGYGACRIAEEAAGRLTEAARAKAYLGYSDAGCLLAVLYKHGFESVAHGPVAQDVLRAGGEEAAARALRWLVERTPDALEPSLKAGEKAAAFNMITFSQLLGTPLEPDLTGHALMLEEVSEALYRIDRTLFHITSNASVRRVAGIRLGRCTDIPPNDPDFGMTEEEIARFWCARAGIPYLGRADIGHDAGNKVVPFGSAPAR